jgi:hypothetical protein
MAKHLSTILQEADEIIGSRSGGQVKTASSLKDEDILNLAALLQAPQVKQASEELVDSDENMTVTEKIAHALAITECLMNLDELAKMHQFEKAAQEKGYSEAQIEEFIEKRASTPGRLKSVLKVIPWLGGAAALGGGAGAVKGYRKGREGGYTAALQDVNQAMEEYAK